MEQIEFSEEALKKLYISIKKFSCFTEEERDAICCYVPMTQEMFDICLEKAAFDYDYEMVEYLMNTFPEFKCDIEADD